MQTKQIKLQKGPLDLFREKCRKRGISITPQRVTIYTYLIGSKDHPDAESIYNKVKGVFPDISIDTVYRTLSTFSEMGLIDEVEGYGKAKRYDPDLKPHHHFRCRKCEKIVDFQEDGLDNLEIPKAIREKYSVLSVKVVAEGLCDVCRRK